MYDDSAYNDIGLPEKTAQQWFDTNGLNFKLYDEWSWAMRECCPELGYSTPYPFRGAPTAVDNFGAISGHNTSCGSHGNGGHFYTQLKDVYLGDGD